MSKIGRSDLYYNKFKDKNNFQDMDFVERYLDYYTEQ